MLYTVFVDYMYCVCAPKVCEWVLLWVCYSLKPTFAFEGEVASFSALLSSPYVSNFSYTFMRHFCIFREKKIREKDERSMERGERAYSLQRCQIRELACFTTSQVIGTNMEDLTAYLSLYLIFSLTFSHPFFIKMYSCCILIGR